MSLLAHIRTHGHDDHKFSTDFVDIESDGLQHGNKHTHTLKIPSPILIDAI